MAQGVHDKLHFYNFYHRPSSKKKTLEMQFGELEGVVSFTTVVGLSQAECSSPWLQEVVGSPFNEPAIIEVT